MNLFKTFCLTLIFNCPKYKYFIIIRENNKAIKKSRQNMTHIDAFVFSNHFLFHSIRYKPCCSTVDSNRLRQLIFVILSILVFTIYAITIHIFVTVNYSKVLEYLQNISYVAYPISLDADQEK